MTQKYPDIICGHPLTSNLNILHNICKFTNLYTGNSHICFGLLSSLLKFSPKTSGPKLFFETS